MNTHPILQNVIDGLVLGHMRSPGMEPPRPMGCPSCAAAEAQCDRLAQRIRELEAEVCDAAFAGHLIGADRAQERIRELEAALDLEAKARVAAAEMAHDAKLALDEALESIQSLEARLEVEARTTWSLLSYLADLRFALGDDGRRMQDELLNYCCDFRRAKDAIQAALGNGADEAAWEPGEHWADAAARKIREARETPCTR